MTEKKTSANERGYGWHHCLSCLRRGTHTNVYVSKPSAWRRGRTHCPACGATNLEPGKLGSKKKTKEEATPTIISLEEALAQLPEAERRKLGL